MGACYFSTIAQLAERMTVNHDVVGSRPAGGVKKYFIISSDVSIPFAYI